MGTQIPVIEEKPLAVCGCRKFQVDALDDHLCTCTAHSGAKKAHDWAVDQLADLFRTTHKVKTQQVVKSRGQHCGDIELKGYLANADSYSLIGKLTAFLQRQEFCQRNQIVDSSTTVARLFHRSLTLTPHTRKLLVVY